jgi:type III pantothenate kinase
MKLLVDLGNSRIKWAWHEQGLLLSPASAPATDGLPGDMAGRRPDAIVLASVASVEATASLRDALEQRHGVAVRAVGTGRSSHGVTNGYVEPAQLGVDRWLAMIAGYVRYRSGLCIVSAGTAVTVDAVAADGRHLGGFIVPGLALMREALLRETGRIGVAAGLLDAGEPAADGWGRDTESCMRLGAVRAVVGLVESCMKSLAPPGAALLLTGGDGAVVHEELSVPAECLPALVLEGLALVADERG